MLAANEHQGSCVVPHQIAYAEVMSARLTREDAVGEQEVVDVLRNGTENETYTH